MRKIFLMLLCCVVYWPSYAGDGASMTGYVFKYVNSCHYRDGDRPGTSEPMWFVDDDLKNDVGSYAFDSQNDVWYLMDDDGFYNSYVSYGFSKSEKGFRTYDLNSFFTIDLGDEFPLFLSVNADYSTLTLTGCHGQNDTQDRTDFYSRTECSATPRPMSDEDTEDPDAEDDSIHFAYMPIEEQATFQGGDLETFRKWVLANRQYPANSIEGRVIVEFVVEKDGTLSNFNIVRSPDQALSDETLRVLKLSPRWIPAKQNHKPVRMQFLLPVDFFRRN